jgi:serine/threonine protein kinase
MAEIIQEYIGKYFTLKNTDENTICKSASLLSLPYLLKLKVENESSFLQENINGFRPISKVQKSNTEINLFFQYVDGKTLDKHCDELIDIKNKLKLCIAIVKQLAKVHSQEIIHLNINTKHILIENNTNNIYFISNGLAKQAHQKTAEDAKLLYTLTDPDFIAPEQTGRINKEVSYTSDIYSLGVVFYRIFTNQLPFNSKEGAAKIHAHIAIKPNAPSQISETPDMLSELIMKMLNKDTESRYQSADGILYDLEIIFNQWQLNGIINKFELGLNDFSGTLRISNQLFGRDVVEILKN